jgi:hypothetical protein
MLFDTRGNLLVDFVGKFERLQNDFELVCKQLGFKDSGLPHINSSDKKSRELRRSLRNILHGNRVNRLSRYVDFYDEETRESVAWRYREDIENFNYSFADAMI